MGSGACDFSLWFSKQLEKYSISHKIYCIDNDPRVVEYASQKCADNNNIHILHDSALNLKQSGINPDYIFANHFLHHFNDNDLRSMLSIIDSSARYGYVLNDLERSPLWYMLFWAFGIVFLTRSFTLYDGLLSIKKGFTVHELRAILSQQNISQNIKVKKINPGRIVVYNFK